MANIEFAFTPYPLQKEIIAFVNGDKCNIYGEPYRFFIAALGRQTGKSWLAKFLSLEYAAKRNKSVMWVAPTISAARSHWNDLVKLIRASGMIEAGVCSKPSQQAKEITFTAGGSITVRSAIEPDNLRGGSLDLIICDEAAFYRNGSYVWYSVIQPMVTATGGKILVTTTPNGRNWLYTLYLRGKKETDKLYKSWNFTAYVSPHQDKELLDDLKQTMPSQQWREEYMAEFLADGGGVFAGVDIASVVDMLYEPVELHEYVVGVDVGYNNDYTAITVVDTTERRQVWGKRFTGTGTIHTIRSIISVLEQWQPTALYIEKNGGETFVNLLRIVLGGGEIDDIVEVINNESDGDGEDSIETVGKYKLVAIHVNNDIKRRMVERLAADIEYKRFTILSIDTDYGTVQNSEMSTYERKPTSSGMSVTYNAAEGSHDDTVSALYLAYSGVKKYSKAKSVLKRNKRPNPFRAKPNGRGLASMRSKKYA